MGNATGNQQVKSKGRGGAPKNNSNSVKSGHYRRKAQLKAVSFDDLHKNSSGGLQLFERRTELIDHCGGTENVSAVTRRVIERTCLTEYLLDHVDLYLAQLGPKIIRRRDKILAPIVAERSRLLDSLLKLYQVIGVDRQQRPVPGLKEYLDGKSEEATPS